MTNKILVTGGTGRLGNVLTRKLVAQGHEVGVLVREGSSTASLEGIEFTQETGDILDLESLNKAISKYEYVYHVASVITITSKLSDPKVEAVNIQGTKNVVDASIKHGIKRLLYVSSIHALEEPPHGTALTEELPFDEENDRGVYDITKAKASNYVLSSGLDSVIVMPTGIVGPYDYRPSLFGGNLKKYLESPEKYFIAGAYDYVDVRDVADGMIGAMEKGRSGSKYILSGETMSIPMYFQYIEEITGLPATKKEFPLMIAMLLAKITGFLGIKSGGLNTYGLRTLVSNSDISHGKATAELGYSPRSIKKSIEDQISWLKGTFKA